MSLIELEVALGFTRLQLEDRLDRKSTVTQNVPLTDGERSRSRVKKWRAGGDAAPCGLPLAFAF